MVDQIKLGDADFDVQIKDADIIISCGVEIHDLPKSVKVLPPDPSQFPDHFDPHDKILVVYPNQIKPPMHIINVVRERATLANVGEQTLYSVTQRCADNIIDNLFSMHRASIFPRAFGGTCKGVPAFIVGAGPSLDRNIETLSGAQKHGLVFAVDAACGALWTNDIQPDFTVTLESKGSAHYLTHNVDSQHHILALDITSHPSHWRVPSRFKTVFCNNDPAYSEPILQMGGVPISYGGSVSLVAFTMAYYMGCDPVVLIGNDYAYTGDRCYARNTKWEEQTIKRIKKEELQGDLIEFVGCPGRGRTKAINCIDAPAWGGVGTVITSHEMLTYRDWLQQAARRCNTQIINATEGGVHINGVMDVCLEEVLMKMDTMNIKKDQIYDIEDSRNYHPMKTDTYQYISTVEERAKDLLKKAFVAMQNPSPGAMFEMRKSFHRLPILGAYIVQWAIDYHKRAHELKPSDAIKSHVEAVIKGTCRIIEHIEKGGYNCL